MATGKSWTLDFSGGHAFRIFIQEYYDTATNSSTLQVTGAQFAPSKSFSSQIYPGGTITIDGQLVRAQDQNTDLTFNVESPTTHQAVVAYASSYYDVNAIPGYGLSAPWGIDNPIYHNADGTKTVTVSVNLSCKHSQYGRFSVSGSKTIELTSLHTHSYSSTVVDPTCTEQGYTTHTCSCGDNYKDTYTDALGHDYAEATCTEPKTCIRCNATDGYALGHIWDEGVVISNPTYTENGIKEYSCTRTGCEITKTELIQRLGAGKRFIPIVFVDGEEYIPYVYESSGWQLYIPNVSNGSEFEQY